MSIGKYGPQHSILARIYGLQQHSESHFFWGTLYKERQVWKLMNDQSPVQRLQRMHNANICRTKLIKLWILHCPYWHWCFLRVGERHGCLWSCPLCERKVNNRICKWRISIWHQQFSSTMRIMSLWELSKLCKGSTPRGGGDFIKVGCSRKSGKLASPETIS